MRSNSLFILIGSLMLSGCFATGKDGNQRSGNEDPAKAFVEVSIEYPGPQHKWSGPQNFIVRVSTVQPGAAEITVAPPLERNRGAKAMKTPLSAEKAREQMSKLYSAMTSDDSAFFGCLLPIHVRMVRVDGTTVEKQGCRSPGGWPRVAGEVAHFLIDQLENQIEK